jgi:hypothetical protein
MDACSEYISLIVEVASGAAGKGDRLRLEDHLESCAACSLELERLSGLLGLTRQPETDPGDAYWDAYYGRLVERMDGAGVSSPGLNVRAGALLQQLSASLRAPRWALQLAVAVLLVVSGIVIGRTVLEPRPEGPALAVVPDPGSANGLVQRTALEQRAHAYLDRSKTLLLGLVNFDVDLDDPRTLNVDRRRQMAGDLVSEATVLQDELAAADQQRLRQLISDLEIILMQIANIESVHDVPEIEMVQDGVNRKAILFKIEVEEMRRLEKAMPVEETTPVNPSI